MISTLSLCGRLHECADAIAAYNPNFAASIERMRFEQPVPLTEIAALIGAEIIGNNDGAATGINEIHKVEEGDLVFVDHPKYYQKCINSAATYIIINKETDFPPHKSLLLVEEPFEAYQKIISHYRPFMPLTKNISDSAQIGEGSIVMPG